MSDIEAVLEIPDKEESVEVEVKTENENVNVNENENENVNENENENESAQQETQNQTQGQVNGVAPSMMVSELTNASSAPEIKTELAATNTNTNTNTPGASASASATPANTPSGRLQVEEMMTTFQKQLGPNWDKYSDVLTHFLVGRLSRHELQEALDSILDRSMIKMHNQFLLANLCNSLRAAPSEEEEGGSAGRLTSWSRKRGRSGASGGSQKVKGDTQMAQLKKEVLSLPPRERKRIKAITREAGKKGYIASTIINTRQAMLPRIPFVQDKDQVGKQGNTVTWTQDIIHGYQTQLATESRELPDADHLRPRMMGIALEHGVLGGLGNNVVELIQVGLEYYLKGIIQETIEMVKLRKKKDKEAVATVTDMAVVLENAPSLAVETCAPVARLNNVMLQNDIIEQPEPAKSELNNLLDGLLAEF